MTEVALAVQFEPIEITPPHLGIFALQMRELGYGNFQQHSPLKPVVEQFGTQRSTAQFVLDFGPPAVRSWFISDDKNRLVQIQHDRLIHNWRKLQSADEYPRYESIREVFAERFREYIEFVGTNGLGEVQPNQVEVTYVNHVRQQPGEKAPLGLSQVIGLANSSYTDGFLPTPEGTRAVASYVIERNGSSIGRLHVNAHTAFAEPQKEPLIVINLTARGAPLSPDLDGVLGFMDLGREWVVRGFADVTRPAMHKVWRRTQ